MPISGDRPEDRAAKVIADLLDQIEKGEFHRGDASEYGILYNIMQAWEEG